MAALAQLKELAERLADVLGIPDTDEDKTRIPVDFTRNLNGSLLINERHVEKIIAALARVKATDLDNPHLHDSMEAYVLVEHYNKIIYRYEVENKDSKREEQRRDELLHYMNKKGIEI